MPFEFLHFFFSSQNSDKVMRLKHQLPHEMVHQAGMNYCSRSSRPHTLSDFVQPLHEIGDHSRRREVDEVVDVFDGLAVADLQLEPLPQVLESLRPPVDRRDRRGGHQGEQTEHQLRVSEKGIMF